MRGNRVSVSSPPLSLSLCTSAYRIMRFRDLAGYSREIRAEKYRREDEESLYCWSKTFSKELEEGRKKGGKEGRKKRFACNINAIKAESVQLIGGGEELLIADNYWADFQSRRQWA